MHQEEAQASGEQETASRSAGEHAEGEGVAEGAPADFPEQARPYQSTCSENRRGRAATRGVSGRHHPLVAEQHRRFCECAKQHGIIRSAKSTVTPAALEPVVPGPLQEDRRAGQEEYGDPHRLVVAEHQVDRH